MTRDELLRAAREALAEVAPERADVSLLVDFPPTGETSAAHATIAEVTLVTAIETVFTRQLGELAPAAIAKFAGKRTRAAIYQVFLYGSINTSQRTDGKGSCAKRMSMACPACQRPSTVDYVGSDVVEGSLEWVHVVHTKVDDWFICSACAHAWREHHFI